jgi:hypothetical protein
MKKQKEENIEFSSIKLQSKGAKGLTIKFGYLFSFQNSAVCDNVTLNRDAPVHSNLLKHFKELMPIVSKVESIDYARNLLDLEGFEPTDTQRKLTEKAVQEKLKQIEVTGISITTKKDIRGVIITYDKYDENEQVTGHVTSRIAFGDIIYKIEEDLEDAVDSILEETYKYLYEEKFDNMEQLSISAPSEEIEDAEEVVDNN